LYQKGTGYFFLSILRSCHLMFELLPVGGLDKSSPYTIEKWGRFDLGF
jgi:hypothetical protein